MNLAFVTIKDKMIGAVFPGSYFMLHRVPFWPPCFPSSPLSPQHIFCLSSMSKVKSNTPCLKFYACLLVLSYIRAKFEQEH